MREVTVVRMGKCGESQVFLVSLNTRAPETATLQGLVGIIWELTAHSVGLMGFSLNGVHGEERGVTITEVVLGVGGSDGVMGRESRGEGEEEEARGVGRGRGGGGGGFVSASMSLPCKGNDRGGQERMGTG